LLGQIADLVAMNYRSPTFLLLLGGGCLALSLGLATLQRQTSVGSWVLLIISVAVLLEYMLLEGTALVAAGLHGQNRYDVEKLIYRPASVFRRGAILALYASAVLVLGRGGLNVLDGLDWRVAVSGVFGPFFGYLAWGMRAYWRLVAKTAQAEGWVRVR
jgi:hypothetical protein